MSSEGVVTVDGACHHDCPDSCGWTATVDVTGPEPVAVKLRGNPDHPFSRGELCPKVNKFLDRAYSDDRVLHPLRRVGPKGSGRFEQVSWDDALHEIGERLGSVIATHGATSILPFSDAGNQSLLSMFAAGGRLWSHLGTTQVTGSVCGMTAGAGAAATNGSGAGLEATDMVHSRLIVIWGTNTRLTNRHLWPFIEQARQAGARIVVIDPIRTLTAQAVDESRGDRFIQPHPGTDVAMMLAMMRVIIDEGLADQDWIERHTTGFDELRAAVADWTPERAAAECGVDAEVIVALARDVATTRPTAFRTLIGAEHHEHGAMFFRTLACLPAITGAWRDLGGGFSRSVGYWTEGQIDWDALQLPSPGPRRQVNMNRLGEVLSGTHLGAELEPPIHALVVWNVNPAVTIPNADLIQRGLGRDDLFTVVHEQFLTDTARSADIVLPATTQLEADDVVFPWGHLWVNYNRAAIPPRGTSCNNTELFRRIAGALGLTHPALFASDEQLMRDAMPTIDLEELRRRRWLETPLYPADRRPFGDPDGTTPIDSPSGRIELASATLEADGHPRVPTYRRGPARSATIDHPDRFHLLTPKQHSRFLNSGYSHLPKHGRPEGGPFVELHRDDAAR
ncbi:MAG: molybdopterin-dependent oxidoreductase, partial [Actinomycetota bacterium]